METPSEVDRLSAEVRALRTELDEARRARRLEREHEQLRHRDYVIGLLAETQTALERNEVLARRVDRLRERLEQGTRAAGRREAELRAELDAVHASRVWRARTRVRRVVPGARS